MKNLAILGEKEFALLLSEKIRNATSEIQVEVRHVESFEHLSFTQFDLVIDTLEGAAEVFLNRILELESILPEKTAIAAFHPEVSTTDIMNRLQHSNRFIGLHFFKTDRLTNLVEIAKPEQGGNEELRCAVSQLLTAAGFAIVPIKDRPGLLAFRLLVPYLNQAAQAFDDGIASAIDIDNSVILGLGYPTGPLALLDRIGIDRYIKIAGSLHTELSHSKYHTPPILKKMNEAGITGKKDGKGFYCYE